MRVPLNGLIGFALGTLIFGLVFWYLHISFLIFGYNSCFRYINSGNFICINIVLANICTDILISKQICFFFFFGYRW